MNLNEEQQAAVDSKSPMILCLAGAGTGKTETMVSRVVRLVDEGVSPDTILVLTFTNAAAAEMTARYRRKCSYGRIPQFSTFHAYCYRLITIDERIRKALGYIDVPTVADDVMLQHIQNSVRTELGITLSTGKLSGKLTLSPKDQFEYDLYHKEFGKQLKKRGFITFDQMCYEVCKLFEDDSELIQFYKQQLKYIFVDEFQDTDPKQWKFVASIPCDAFVVGDAKQAIYSFRGADSSIIKFLAESDSWETFPLSYNYRSTLQLCDFANTIHRQWKGSAYDLKIRSDRQGISPIFLTQDETYIEQIDQLISENEGKTVAVLARTNSEVNELKRSLTSEAVVDRVSSKNAARAYHLLNSALSDEYFISWASSSLSGDTYRDWMRYLTLIGPDIPHIIEKIPNSYSIQHDWRQVERIREWMTDPDLLPFQKAANIASYLELSIRMLEISDDTPEAIVDCITSAIQLPPNSKVHVGTIHSSKGLEYDVVILVGVNGKSFQLTSEEMLNLYYVGVTRAKTSLYIMKVDD